MAKQLLDVKVIKAALTKSLKDTKKQIFYDDKKSKIEVYLNPSESLAEHIKVLSDLKWSDYDPDDIEFNLQGDFKLDEVLALYEIVRLKSYKFFGYPGSKQPELKSKNISKQPKVKVKAEKKLPAGFKFAAAKLDAKLDSVFFCRDIVNQNASDIHPGYFAEYAKSLAKKCSYLSVNIIDAKEAKKANLNCLLAVGSESLKNSAEEYHPRLVILEYKPPRTRKQLNHLAVVGKGITYDTGGLCLKPTKYMLDMKSDMAGAAAVLSLFNYLSKLSADELPKMKLTGVMALTENGFGASSYKPGDVLKAGNGKTVQVVDTDAEGRLALADGLSYCSKLEQKPDYIVDLATLTGSIVASLGEVAAGAMTNNQEFVDLVLGSFNKQGDRLWQMPLLDEHKDLLKSDIADMAHCSSRPDALVAGHFLQNFIPKGSKWVHLDIAGVGFIENDGLRAYKGATGFGVKGLAQLLNEL